MTAIGKRLLFWTPRVLAIAYIAFLSLFALDVFAEEHGLWATLTALAIHLLPALALLTVLILAWRWEWIGTVFYAAAGALYSTSVLSGRIPVSTKITWILMIALPAFLVAALFLASWLKHVELRTPRQPQS